MGTQARKVGGRAHSPEQAHACRGSQVEGCACVSLLGHVPKCLLQAFHQTLAGPGRVVCVAGNATPWREAVEFPQQPPGATGQKGWGLGLPNQVAA